MSDHSWRRVGLGEICATLLNGGTPDTNTHKYWTGQIPWVTGADFANQALSQVRRRITAAAVKQSATNVVKAGNILLVTRTGVGKIAIAPYDVAISQDITGIYFGDGVYVRFMYYCLQSHMEEFKKLNQGTSINGILKEDFLTYHIDLPPLPQQHKIARILTTVDNLIERTEALIAKYQAIKQGMMHDLFTRGVDEHGHLRSPYEEAPKLYKPSELGWIPKNWTFSCVAREFQISTGFTLGLHRRPKENRRPYLRVANVQRDEIRLDDVADLEATDSEFESRQLQLNDLLVVEGHADPNQIGRCAG
jgi:type I restriction enzyme S subunit